MSASLKLVLESTSPYKEFGERYVDAGYSALPIKPGTKFPGQMLFGAWKDSGMPAWQRFCNNLPTHIEVEFWNAWPDSGVGVALGFQGMVALDLDTDDPKIMAAILSV